ncbi:MAG: hypothetical protein R6U85_13375 [Salinivirgaceae bacterium]
MKTRKILTPVLAASVALMVSFTSCTETSKQAETKQQTVEKQITITKQEVLEAQKGWGEGIVKIGKVYSDGGDYEKAAKEHIDKFYGYNMGKVLFKPTLAAEKQFRTTVDGALSYFVGGNDNYTEDHGFAIKPWNKVRWESIGIKTEGNMAVAMGNYFFTPTEGGDEVKVEYTFAYSKDDNGKLRIIMHGSHLPYNPEH